MKIRIIVALALFPILANAQTLYKNEILLLAEKTNADIGIGNEWYPAKWRISPQIAHDTLHLKIYSTWEDFGFRTDKDSIKFKIIAGESRSFYVKLGSEEPAHTVITAQPYQWDKITFNKTDKRKDIKLLFEKKDNPYFDSLRHLYPLEQVIKNDRSDTEKVLSILNWTHHQWKHDGGNAPKGGDGISILNEARAGGRFPCFAYAIVLADQLMAHGYKARVIYLKTKDAETRKNGSPGHVATEVYLNDLKKWVFVDGQFNVMPSLDGKLLNAAEFQQALSQNYDDVVLKSRDEVSKRGYTDFIYSYLYYFDTPLDNRLLASGKATVDGKRSIMLVPVGAANLTKISFWDSTIDYCVYTHSLKDFYPQL